MGVVADVVFAVAEVAVALGAVAELQLGIRNIGATADGTAMVIRGADLGGAGLIRAASLARGSLCVCFNAVFV